MHASSVVTPREARQSCLRGRFFVALTPSSHSPAVRLNCYGEAFAEMRERLGGINPVTAFDERKRLRAEIDAAAFHAYGLAVRRRSSSSTISIEYAIHGS